MINTLRNIFIVVIAILSIACSSVKQAVLVPDLLVSKDSLKRADNIFIDALKNKSLGNVEEAKTQFIKTLSFNPRNDAAYFELSRIYYSQKDVVSARELIEKAIYLSPKNEWYLMLYTDFLKEDNELKKCEEVFYQLSIIKPNNTDFLIEIVNLQIAQRKYKDALASLESIKKQLVESKDFAMQKEELHRALGQNDEAIATILKFVGTDTLNTDKLLIIALTYKQNGKIAKSVNTYERVIELDDENGLALLELSDHYRKLGDREKHQFYQEKAFASTDISYDAKIRTLFSYIQLLSKDPSLTNEALKLAQIISETHSSEANAYAIYAEILYNAKQLESAKTNLYKAISLKQDVYNYWNQLLVITAELEQYEELIKIADSAILFFPNQSIICYLQGIAYNQLDQFENTIAPVERGLSISFDNIALKAELHALLGEAYHNLENYELSDQHFGDCIEIDSNNVFVLNNYSYYLSVRNEKLPLAERLSKRSNQLSPNSQSFEDTYAWILYRLAKYDLALIWINKAIEHGGYKNGVILEHKGDILFQLGNKADAIEQWKIAKSIGQNSDLIDKKIKDGKLHE
jgi:tetratricopeptide (TPR) repeat protein